MSERFLDLPLEQVLPDATQPRKYFDECKIRELADSIAKHGLLQPILVRPWNGVFQIIHGERRYRAHQKLEATTIKAIVRELSDSEVEDVRLVENLERDNLSDIELAWEFDRRVKAGQTHEQIGKVIGKSRAFVTQRLALLKLSKDDQHKLETGELDFTTARVLASQKTENQIVKPQHGYGVTMEKLEVYQLFQKKPNPDLDVLYRAYRKDFVTIRKALRGAK